MHPYCTFSLWRQRAPQQTAKFQAAGFREFRSTLRKDSISNYGLIWTQFPPSVRELDILYNALNGYDSSSVGRCHHTNRKFVVAIFQNVKINF